MPHTRRASRRASSHRSRASTAPAPTRGARGRRSAPSPRRASGPWHRGAGRGGSGRVCRATATRGPRPAHPAPRTPLRPPALPTRPARAAHSAPNPRRPLQTRGRAYRATATVFPARQAAHFRRVSPSGMQTMHGLSNPCGQSLGFPSGSSMRHSKKSQQRGPPLDALQSHQWSCTLRNVTRAKARSQHSHCNLLPQQAPAHS
mmetsp:Transcript_120528/g.336290  ORF Transcript_120528/g.336290 Transcript_120528/m.336290 type:complete len:203 (+) Transcript_120528:461-1069(+)